MSEKLYILDKDGSYTEASKLDEAIKESIKKNDNTRNDKRCDGSSTAEQDEAGDVDSSTEE
jgi:hypothetical protein